MVTAGSLPMATEADKGPGCAPGVAEYSDAWQDIMIEAAGRLGIDLPRAKARLFARHGRELALWNRKINLTAVSDPVQVACRHFADSVAALKYLRAGGKVLDLGSGGGFPGLPLKIMRPEIDLVLVDGSGKKVNFIKHVIRTLGLDNTRALHARAEEMAADHRWQGHFDHVVCRALGTVVQVASLALPLLAPEGRLLIWKAGRWQEKEADFTPGGDGSRFTIAVGATVLEAVSHPYRLPGGSDSRQIVELMRRKA